MPGRLPRRGKSVDREEERRVPLAATQGVALDPERSAQFVLFQAETRMLQAPPPLRTQSVFAAPSAAGRLTPRPVVMMSFFVVDWASAPQPWFHVSRTVHVGHLVVAADFARSSVS